MNARSSVALDYGQVGVGPDAGLVAFVTGAEPPAARGELTMRVPFGGTDGDPTIPEQPQLITVSSHVHALGGLTDHSLPAASIAVGPLFQIPKPEPLLDAVHDPGSASVKHPKTFGAYVGVVPSRLTVAVVESTQTPQWSLLNTVPPLLKLPAWTRTPAHPQCVIVAVLVESWLSVTVGVPDAPIGPGISSIPFPVMQLTVNTDGSFGP